jgi:hypothetical protein
VLATTAELEVAVGITTWDGDPPSAGFSAIGARGASFIVVPAGRNWYPTDRPNVVAPVAARIEADREAVVEPEGTPYRLEFTRTA